MRQLVLFEFGEYGEIKPRFKFYFSGLETSFCATFSKTAVLAVQLEKLLNILNYLLNPSVCSYQAVTNVALWFHSAKLNQT